jgi:hypothetical protein
MQHLSVCLCAPMDSMRIWRTMNVLLALITVKPVSLYIMMKYSVTFVKKPISVIKEHALKIVLVNFLGILIPNYVKLV